MYATIDDQIERRKRSRAAGEACRNDLLDVMLDKKGELEVESDDMGRPQELFTWVDHEQDRVGAMAELLLNPRSMQRVQEEPRGVLDARTQVAESDTDRLPYLQAVVKETLRLHHTVPIGLNKAEATGTTVYVNIWDICRRAKTWADDLDKFMPEKMIGISGTNFELIPFCAGRRICFGMPLAERMLHLMLASVLARFDWAPIRPRCNVIDMEEQFGLVLSMATPFRAVAKQIL
ncbi:hypothetical protein U9M48_000928 [Paspalum notatum var. saurae]|uniref:Cytochrome P450 n=1 Tax=Paspalum notatum var. saurae TaxID=547442 RepID=A0AAQ3PHK4_PASNO